LVAEAHGIPLLLPEKPREIREQLRSYGAEAAVLVAYGRIISQSIIDLFPKGIINIHPSLLPRWRGPSPIEAPLLAGDEATGVSLMQLTAGMDEGPIYAQVRLPLDGSETKLSLCDTLSQLSSELLFESLPGILNGDIQPVAQAHEKATYSRLLSKQDSWLLPEQLTAAEAERKVRAHQGFPKTKITVQGKPLIILESHVSPTEPALGVRCQDDNYLAIDRLVAPHGKSMDADAYLRGQQR
jgi:methionyl-tRNA formyltransferase